MRCFDMTSNWDGGHRKESNHDLCAVFVDHVSVEDGLSADFFIEVLVVNPAGRFLFMPASCPSPQRPVNKVVDS